MTEKEFYEQVCFYPYVDVEAAFKKAKTIIEGQPNELELLRDFYKSMKFFYDIASIQESDPDSLGGDLLNLYKYAKQGADIT